MPRLRHCSGSPWPGGYSGGAVDGWLQGELRVVDAETAAYLLGTFGDAFAEEPTAEEPAAPSGEPAELSGAPAEQEAGTAPAEPPARSQRRR